MGGNPKSKASKMGRVFKAKRLNLMTTRETFSSKSLQTLTSELGWSSSATHRPWTGEGSKRLPNETKLHCYADLGKKGERKSVVLPSPCARQVYDVNVDAVSKNTDKLVSMESAPKVQCTGAHWSTILSHNYVSAIPFFGCDMKTECTPTTADG